jgi:RNA polymerase sigma factor (sigma-70 family)
MSKSELGTVLRRLRKLAVARPAPELSDQVLLQRFAGHGEETAFASLMQRHGPLVLSVCRNVLHHQQDAEDAFQATFLVLARKAAIIRQGNSLASWLYGVALRTAMKAKTAAANRRALQSRGGPSTPQPDPVAEAALRELQTILHEEVQRLPEKYRAPFVLCCLEGYGRSEAARQLGWNEGTLSGRLAEARKRLQQRLTRRGVALSAALAAKALAANAALAMPAGLMSSTLQTVLRGPTEAISVLAQSMMKATATSRLILAVLFLVVGVAGVGARLLVQSPNPAAVAGDVPLPVAQISARADWFGDPLPPRALARLGTVRFRFDGNSGRQWLAFLPDDQVLATAGGGFVSFWDAATGKELRRLDARAGGLADALSPDGKTLAEGTRDHLVFLWDAATGKELRRLHGHQGEVHAVAFSPDGHTLVSGSQDKSIRFWDVATGKELHRFQEEHEVWAVTLAPDDKTLAVVSGKDDSKVSLRETTTGKELRHFRVRLPVLSVAFAPDGRTVAAQERANGGDPDCKLHLWDVATGHLRRITMVREGGLTSKPLFAPAFSPNSKILATANEPRFHLWDVATAKPLAHFPGRFCYTSAVAFSRDGRILATSGDSTVRLWEVSTGTELTPKGGGHQGQVEALLVLPGGKTILSAGRDGRLCAWETTTGKELRQLPLNTGLIDLHASFSADGALLTWQNEREISICETATGKVRRRLATLPYSVCALAPDGQSLAVCIDHSIIQILDVTTGRQKRQLPKCAPNLQAIVFSPDGRMLASVSETDDEKGSVIQFWDIGKGALRGQLQCGRPWQRRFAFSPDGKTLASVGEGQLPCVWEVASGKERRPFPRGDHRAWRCAFSPDGRVLALGMGDGEVKLVETATGRELRRMAGHQSEITCLTFSADGRTLVSGSADTSALVWDVSDLVRTRREVSADLSPRELEKLWIDLASEDATRAYEALQALAAAPRQTVPFLKEHLRPVAPADARHLRLLLADLDSASFAVRQKAATDLELLGESAEAALRRALEERPSLEVRRRVESLVEKLNTQRSSPPAPERLRELRGVEALEQIGNAAARHALAALAQGNANARLTLEALAAVERLNHKLP